MEATVEVVGAVGLLIILATLIEVVIEAIKPALRPLVDRMNLPEDVNAYLYIALVLGLLLAFSTDANVLAIALDAIDVELTNQVAVVTGVAVTGLIIGRGSNFVHDALGRLRPG